MLTRRAWLVLAALLLSTGVPSAQTVPVGRAIDAVTTLDDATQSYALYLPSTYTTDRSWPILIGFHPGARGRAIVDTYRDAAERYGFIVAGSNKSRNGPWDVSLTRGERDVPGHRAAVRGRRQAHLPDRPLRRIARGAADRAGEQGDCRCHRVERGVSRRPAARSVAFPIFGTAGMDDFNYIEMRMLGRALEDAAPAS